MNTCQQKKYIEVEVYVLQLTVTTAMPIHQCLYFDFPKRKKGKGNSIINSNIFNPDVKMKRT